MSQTGLDKVLVAQEYNPFRDQEPRTVVNVYVTNNIRNTSNQDECHCDLFELCAFALCFNQIWLLPCHLLRFCCC